MMKEGSQKIQISIVILLLIISTITSFATIGTNQQKTESYITQNSGNITISNIAPPNQTINAWPYTDYYGYFSTGNVGFKLNQTNGTSMNYSVYTNVSGTWELISWDTDVASDVEYTVGANFMGFTDWNTTYWWAVNVSTYASEENRNETFWFRTGNQTHATLNNLSWGGLTFLGTEDTTYVWCNSTGTFNETMEINITVNETANISDINIWLGDLYAQVLEVGASNFTVYISGNGTNGSFFRPECNLGKGNGTFLNGFIYETTPNITLNKTTWGTHLNCPWDTHGDGLVINEACSIWVRIRVHTPTFTNQEIELIRDEGGFSPYTTGRVYFNNSDDTNFLMYRTLDMDLDYQQEWHKKPGYTNCTYGPPDFSQKQSNWYNLIDFNWYMCGPVALANCLWWLDCKYNNNTQNYFLPDFCGLGSKHQNNVINLINWTANYTNTSRAEAADEPSGTTAENFTHGIWGILENVSLNGTFATVQMDGFTFEDNWDVEAANYTNITTHIDACDDVILLLGFWCETPVDGWKRIGGHYVQVNGWNNVTTALSITDPYKDNAENGSWGWNSTHSHGSLGYSSHNWTQNVSYDYYTVSPMPASFVVAPPQFYQLDNYTDGMGNISNNWSNQNDYDNTYPHEGQSCVNMSTVIEIAWYIMGPQSCSVEVNKTIWDGTSWVVNYTNGTVGDTITTNISFRNVGGVVKSMYVMDSYNDAFIYQNNTSVIYLPNGSVYAREPNTQIPCEAETCTQDQHGNLYWYLNYSEGALEYGEILYIHSNWTINRSRFSSDAVSAYVCLENNSCFWPSIDCETSTTTSYLNQEFNLSITCAPNPDETSNWTNSEYIHRNCTTGTCFDQLWFEYETEFYSWYSSDTGVGDWGWVYRYYDLLGDKGDDLGLSYTIANDSCANRTQIILRLRNSYEPVDDTAHVGVIYSYYNNSHYDMILYGQDEVFLLSKRRGILVNTNDSSPVWSKAFAYNYWNAGWSCNDSWYTGVLTPDNEGIWTKILYNDLCDRLKVKAWDISAGNFSRCLEPPGWILDEENISTNHMLVDYYPSQNRDDALNIYQNHPGATMQSAVGQYFTTPPGMRYNLSRAVFSLRRTGTPDGNMYAALYEVTDCGADKTATGFPLAVSEPYPCMNLDTVEFKNVTFYFNDTGGRHLMNASYDYAIVALMDDNTNGGALNYTEVGDHDGGPHPGNEVYYDGGGAGWDCYGDYDAIFYVYGVNWTNSTCFGLAYWNPGNSTTVLGDYDNIDKWRLNYSRDDNSTQSELDNHTMFGADGIPLMYFKATDIDNFTTPITDWYSNVYVEWFAGNISDLTFYDSSSCLHRNLSSNFNMESRPFDTNPDCTVDAEKDDQNDTIYYYSTIISNITSQPNYSIPYDNAFYLQIEDATDGTLNTADGAVVCIDVDNNMIWDENDMAFVWRYTGLGDYGSSFVIYRGISALATGNSDVQNRFFAGYPNCTYEWRITYGQNNSFLLPSLHRYSYHRMYSMLIPLNYLIKDDYTMLNANDKFGLHVATFNSHDYAVPDRFAPWENKNEENCTTYIAENDSGLLFFKYLNLSTSNEIEWFIQGLNWTGVNATQMQYWGFGLIGDEQGELTQDFQYIECNCTDCPTASGSAVEEDVSGNVLNHNWSEYEPTRWITFNTSENLTACPDWEWTYRYNNTDGIGGDINDLTYTIANDSCTNRSFSMLRMRWHTDDEGEWEPYLGIIYSYTDNFNFDMVLYGCNQTFLLSVENGTLVNTVDSSLVTGIADVYTYFADSWPCNSTAFAGIFAHCNDSSLCFSEWGKGLWTKTIYNSYCGSLQAKAWTITNRTFGEDFGMCFEPSGWIVNRSFLNITTNNGTCFGIVVWNPYRQAFTADFDFIEEWRLNYSRNPNATQVDINAHSFGQSGIPFMSFPTSNATIINEAREAWNDSYNLWLAGSISNLTFYDFCTKFFVNTSAYSTVESRPFKPCIDCANSSQYDNQNDTIHYHMSVTTNLVSEESKGYDSALQIIIEDTTDGTNNTGDGAVVAIDIDNNMIWDSNDMAFVWRMTENGNTNYTIWKGTEVYRQGVADANNTYYASGGSCPYDFSIYLVAFPVWYRCSWHRAYSATIPTYYFLDRNGTMLNTEQTFGLHIMSFSEHNETTYQCPVWENWNETSCTYYTINETYYNSQLIWNNYLNCTTFAQIQEFINGTSWGGVNDTKIQNWGQGRIENNTGPLQEPWNINITKTANRTVLENTTYNNSVNYTLIICNNGTLELTNVTVTELLPSCCEYISSSLPTANVTGTDRNWTFNITQTLDAGVCITINITVNFTANCGVPNGESLSNNATVITNESATVTSSSTVIYGNNTAPIIVNVYPSNGAAMPLLLVNISVKVADQNGDIMSVYITTNKTIDVDAGGIQVPYWHSIGQHLLVPNGTYLSNQSFVMDDDANRTRWRWGSIRYYWNVSVTDGIIWTNESFTFTITNSRYDVQVPLGLVNLGDAQSAWSHNAGTYDGIYDVQVPYQLINIGDAQMIWANHD